MKLRPYQTNAIENARKELRRVKSVVLVSPTGSGKTPIGAEIIRRAVERGSSALFIAHRRELINQASDKLLEFGIRDHGIIMGNRRPKPFAPVQVASIKTLTNRKLPPADIILIDEAHRAAARGYLDILANYPNAKVVGLTATPERLDGKGLNQVFDSMVVVATVPELIEQGYLVKPDIFVSPSGVDLSRIKKVGGDYQESALAEATDTPELAGKIVKHYQKHGRDLPAVAFFAGTKNSERKAQAFRDAGIPAVHIDGTTPTTLRDRYVRDWLAGHIKVGCCDGVFIEGFDYPDLYCCILGRATKSITRYLQSVGRVVRPSPNKPGALILDHAGCTDEHGPSHIHREWTLAGEDKRKTRIPGLLRTCNCGFCFEGDPKLFVDEKSPRPAAPELVGHWKEVLDGNNKAKALITCPSCRQGECPVCRIPFVPQVERAGFEGIEGAYHKRSVCPNCAALFTDNAVHEAAERGEPVIAEESDIDLVEYDEKRAAEAYYKWHVQNEFKQWIEVARQKRLKRGFAYHRIIADLGEEARQYLPKRKAAWWQQVPE